MNALRMVAGAVLLGGLAGPVWAQTSEAPVRVSGGVMAGQLLEHANPVYPAAARAAGVSGAVSLRAIIDESGRVATITVISGPEMLQEAAVDAVRSWVYKPYLLNGKATRVDAVITVNFRIAAPEPGKAGPDSSTGTSGSSPAAGICGTPKISDRVMADLLVKRVDPDYPETSEAAGAVVLAVCLTKEGTVEREDVVSGPDALRGAAMRAVKQLVWKPYLIDGEPAAVSTTVTVMFSQR